MDSRIVPAFLICLLALLYPCKANYTTARGYVFTAPATFLEGETESGCLSLHNLEPPAHVLLELLSPFAAEEEEVLASTSGTVKTGIETCLELMVPSTKYTHARLRLMITFDNEDYVVDTQKEIYIIHDNLITFVETDKAVYKPGQDVNIRVLTLKHDLKPWKKQIPKIWIENPSEVRVAQWMNVSTENGMVQLTFSLSSEPSLGTWKISVEKKKSDPQLIQTTTFDVKKYVLPRFRVTITSPRYILADAVNVTWNICAKYSYGKPVKGTLHLKSTSQTPIWRRTLNLPEIHNERELDTPDGCTDFTLSGTVLGLAHWKVAPNNIVLIANFTEAGTGVVETAISRTAVMHQALKLEFLRYTPKYFKLGLPYHGKLRVLHQDDMPASNEKIQLCLKVIGKDDWVHVVVECRNFTSSIDGFIDYIVPPPHRNDILLSFVATGVNHPTKYYSPDKRWRVFMDQPSAYVNVHPWYSPSDSYLAITRGYQPIVCGEKYSFNVMYTVSASSQNRESISFHYSINSKGNLLIYGHVKHKPNRDTVLNYSEFHNLLGAVESPTNKTDHGSVVHRFPLSVKVTPSMAPVSELLLYYVRPDGEIVATTYTIEVGNCFENKVKTAWHTDAQSPGSPTQYHIEAAPWSLCGVSVVDKSTLFLAASKPNLVDANQAFDQLKRFRPNENMSPLRRNCKPARRAGGTEEIHHLPEPALVAPLGWNIQRPKRYLLHYSGFNYVDAVQAFVDFGAVIMSDLLLETRPCPERRFALGRVLLSERQHDRDETDITGFKSAMAMPMAFPLINFSDVPAINAELGYVDQPPEPTITLRSYFPETWLWELLPTGREGKITIERTLPHTITDWVGYTTCVSPIHGLGIAPPTPITAFQPFFLDYNLPYSVKRGEMLRMKVSLFNYMQHSLPVKIKLEDATGLDLHLSHPTASFCVEPRDRVVHEYILRPRVLGDVNITVSASIDPDYAELCGPETLIYTRDVIVKPILVLPEGFPVDMTNSAFICPKDFSDDSTTVWNLDLPKDLVPESGRAYVTLSSDILGPALENLDQLVRLPMGCGEQNMILFVPNIHVIGYLDANNVENAELREKAIKNMEKGYQRELNYRHPDGSYSAFGPAHEGGSSIWLTAFVVKSFAQARNLIHIDERDIKLSVNWITKKQLENGCFPVIGRVFHKDMKGGLQEDNSSSALTAYILISLLESGVPLTASLISNVLYCLEEGMASNDDSPYNAVLTTYALALLEHPKTNSNMQLLLERATHHQDLLWWENKSKSSIGLSVEMTAYAILTLLKIGGEDNMVKALKAIRWMSKQRNEKGGFSSTQDTVLGLEALTKYATAMSVNNTDLSVLVTAGELDHVHRMHNDNRMVLTQIRLPVLPTIVEIFAEGEGCVLIQSNIKYNIQRATGSEAFDLSVEADSVPLTNECSMQKLTVCTRYKMADEESNMALLEIGMISGYVPDRTSLLLLLADPSTKVKRFEENRGVVTIYFDKLTGQKTCISFIVTREVIVDRLEPANVKLYDYYQQELTISASYRFAPTCSSADTGDEQTVPSPVPVIRKEIWAKKSLLLKEFTNEWVDLAINNVTEKLAGSTTTENSNMKVAKKDTEIGRDKIAKSRVADIQPKGDNVPLVENSDHKIMWEHMPGITHVLTSYNIGRDYLDTLQVESGSGQTPDEPDINLNPVFDRMEPNAEVTKKPEDTFIASDKETEESSLDVNPHFVQVTYELETPDGIEGPVTVHVRPDTVSPESISSSDGTDSKFETTTTANGVPDLTPPSTTYATESQERSEMTTGETKDDKTSLPIESQASCPVCSDELPENIGDIYCSAKSAIKVAIRRLRKTRLLLDLHASRDVKRLRSTAEFALSPECTCSPLDNAGSFALVLHKDRDIFTTGDRSKQTLDGSYFVYELPWITGVPRKIAEARSSCESKDQGHPVEQPAGG
ncbi:hypothetical protein KM043_018735 [Ampulex compressa]|nr:hypothetical protein KM043_018735 [Ampulex compressa]